MTVIKRVHMLDTIRGIIIIGVVLYHMLFDLYDIFDVNISWFDSFIINLIRDVGAGMLIFISGISSLLSRNNIKRGIKTLAVALVLSIVTYTAVPDNFIFIGILHFLGTMMLLYGLLGRWINKIPSLAGFFICMVIFAIVYNVLNGYVGFESLWSYDIPYSMRDSTFDYVMGFGGGHLYSADYFPFVPWSFLFLAGTFIGNYVKRGQIPKFLYKDYCPAVTVIGKHTLLIYILHQPIVYGLMLLIFKIIK